MTTKAENGGVVFAPVSDDFVANIDIDRLDVDTIHTGATSIDWREAMGGNCEGWHVIPPGDLQCDNGACMAIVSNGDECVCEDGGNLDAEGDWEQCQFCLGSQEFEDLADGSECPHCGEGTLKDYDVVEAGDEPMMSYFYAVPDMDQRRGGGLTAMARRLNDAHVALCLVEFDPEESGGHEGFALALTGGGMDLSWDICAAFMALECSPPIKYTDLPRFAGQDNTSPRHANIIKACVRSNEIARDWAIRSIERLETLSKEDRS